MRVASTLKPSYDKSLHIGGARFCITDYEAAQVNKITSDLVLSIWMNQGSLSRRAKELYPDLFTDDWTALPVMVKSRMKYDEGTSNSAAMFTGFALGIIPIPGRETFSYSVNAQVRNAFGEVVSVKDTSFDIELGTWTTILSPIGCLPVPGRADLPRDGMVFYIPLYGDPYRITGKVSGYAADCMIGAVAKALESMDQGALEAAYLERRSHLQELTVDGRPCWCFLAPSISREGTPLFMTAMLFGEQPKRDAKPIDQVVVARRDASGRWIPMTGYLHSARQLTALGVLMENGMPSRVAVRRVDEPPIEDFIDTPDLSGGNALEILRWSNGMLLEAKNRTLPRLLREKGADEMLGMVTRIEKAILDLNEQAEKAKDRAQSMVEKGSGDPAPERELAILLRQRIEVLKPVLAALKQTLAGK
jgi:hypothetical protein